MNSIICNKCGEEIEVLEAGEGQVKVAPCYNCINNLGEKQADKIWEKRNQEQRKELLRAHKELHGESLIQELEEEIELKLEEAKDEWREKVSESHRDKMEQLEILERDADE